MKRIVLIIFVLFMTVLTAFAQADRSQVRRGNRDFRKEKYQEAEINYKKALVTDSLSNAAGYNLGNTFFRMENFTEADKYYSSVADSLGKEKHGSDIYHNMGNSLLSQKKYAEACLLYTSSCSSISLIWSIMGFKPNSLLPART